MPPPTTYRQLRFRRPPGGTEIVLVRHGESAPYVPDQPFPRRDGHGDPPLAPVGHRQAVAVAQRLASEPIDTLYVTTLQRTHQTAAPLARALAREPSELADLREVHLGEWEGGSLRERAATGDPVFAEVMAQQRWDVIPGAEPHEAFRARVRRGIETIHRDHPDQLVVAVVHGGVIGLVIAEAVGAKGFAFSPDNASISRIVVVGDRWAVRGFNEVSHLTGIEDDPAGIEHDAPVGDPPGA